MTDDTKTGAATLRAFAMLEMLSGHVVQGLTNKDLASALRCPPSAVTRTADLLIAKGWAEKDETTGRFRVTPTFTRLTFRVLDAFEREERQLNDRKRNYTLSV